MSYKQFLQILSQLHLHGVAKIYIDGHSIEIQFNRSKRTCKILTKIFSGPAIRRAISNRGFLQWDTSGFELKADFDNDNLYLVQEVKSIFKYIYFREIMKDFCKETEQWRGFFVGQNFLYG